MKIILPVGIARVAGIAVMFEHFVSVDALRETNKRHVGRFDSIYSEKQIRVLFSFVSKKYTIHPFIHPPVSEK